MPGPKRPGLPERGNSFPGSNRLTRVMRSKLPSSQPVPERAWAAWSQFSARLELPRCLSLADTPFASEANMPLAMTANLKLVHGATDRPCIVLTPALAASGPAAIGGQPKTAPGITQKNGAPPADPAGPLRLWRSRNGNAHAYRCAPPGRNPGGGPQGKSH